MYLVGRVLAQSHGPDPRHHHHKRQCRPQYAGGSMIRRSWSATWDPSLKKLWMKPFLTNPTVTLHLQSHGHIHMIQKKISMQQNLAFWDQRCLCNSLWKVTLKFQNVTATSALSNWLISYFYKLKFWGFLFNTPWDPPVFASASQVLGVKTYATTPS